MGEKEIQVAKDLNATMIRLTPVNTVILSLAFVPSVG